MNIYLLALTLLTFVMLLVVSAIRPSHGKLNMFELERRAGLGDKYAKKALARERKLGDVISLQRVLTALLQLTVVLLSELTFGLALGILVAVLIAIGYGAIAHLKFIRKLAKKFYDSIEESVLDFIKKAPVLFKLLGSAPTEGNSYNLRFDSREELQYLVAESESALTAEEKKLIVNSLSFNDRLIKTIMTPIDKVSTVKRSDFLGPLMLNDLHKIGHSRLPVINGDIGHIVGILHLEGLLALDIKRSTTAEKAMESKVFYIHENQTLQHALMAFLTTRHYMLIVVNESRHTVGLVTLTDVIEALLGRKIVDEFESHDNLREVAQRKSKSNGHLKNTIDV